MIFLGGKLSKLTGFFNYYAITKFYFGNAIYLLIFLNLLSASIESMGILLFIPFLSQLSGSLSDSHDDITTLLYELFSYFNIQVTVENTLLSLVLAFCLKGVTVFLIHTVITIFLNGVRHTLRENLINLHANVDYLYSISKSSGYFGNMITTETDSACNAMEWFCRALTALITGCTLFTIAFVFYRNLSILMVVVAILSFLLLNRLSSQAKHISFQLSRIRSEMNEFLIQTIQSFKYLRITSLIKPFQDRLSRISKENRSQYNRLAIVNALHMSVQEPLLVICLAGLSYYTVVLSGNSFPSVMVAGLFFYRCMIELMHFNNNWQQLSSQAGSLEIVWSLEKDLVKNKDNITESNYFSFEKSIRIEDVSYVYDSSLILKNINMSIPKYSSVAITGLSGAGKTTLVDIITGLLKPKNGSVLIDGRDLRTLDQHQYRSSIGYVGQDTVLFNTTIANNISMRFNQTAEPEMFSQIQKAAVQSFSDEFIRQLPQGYQTEIGERGIKLSGGQRQRLAIARELFRKPEILILDEATSSLDSQSEEYIRQSIETFKGKMTLIIISHRLSTIINTDMIYVLEQGQIVESGTFGTLSRTEGTIFKKLCELQHVI